MIKEYSASVLSSQESFSDRLFLDFLNLIHFLFHSVPKYIQIQFLRPSSVTETLIIQHAAPKSHSLTLSTSDFWKFVFTEIPNPEFARIADSPVYLVHRFHFPSSSATPEAPRRFLTFLLDHHWSIFLFSIFLY